MATPDCAAPAMGASDTPSTTFPSIDAVVNYASLLDPVIAPATLLLASGMALDGSWRAHRRASLFFWLQLQEGPASSNAMEGTAVRSWRKIH